ncbi:hypothetical protein PFICI_05711 [Pestalotiopsis fici W106-1]|uniref:Rhodopsin domain-containing protein n=1 Tax=Pestalotiopsis fici (strain W106-1 / CGMCC3.15140) TaxID=1229662 RepID=W3XCQ0_PESFW|nr:uncharacterized protein PFICI_05711 [Pestalotiopsis fici W106-1]ETS83835.1 hypothetical protein PFICI_05711 [Pestalotiopsis fici W106-1]
MASNVSFDSLIPPPDEIIDTHKEYKIAIVCIFLGVLASLCVASRLTARFLSRSWGYDDWAVIPATAFYIGWTALAAYINLHAGVGKPLEEITVGEFSLWYKGVVVTTWLYPIMSATIRISILLFYRRIFAIANGAFMNYAIWILLGLQVAYIITFCVLPAFMCQQLHYAWDVYEHPLHCNDWYYFWSQIALYSASMAFDTILLFFPIIPVVRLHLPTIKRVGVLVIFMLGAGASIASAYKLAVFDIEMKRYEPTNPLWLTYRMSRYIPAQFDRYGYTFWIPSQVEPTVALIGTSLPALRPFLASASERVSQYFQTHITSRSTKSTWQTITPAHASGFVATNSSETELWDVSRSKSPRTTISA